MQGATDGFRRRHLVAYHPRSRRRGCPVQVLSDRCLRKFRTIWEDGLGFLISFGPYCSGCSL